MDDSHHPTPSKGLVPDEEQEINPDRLTDDTPDHFDTPVDDEDTQSEPESVYPGDTEFEQDLEDEEIRRYEDE